MFAQGQRREIVTGMERVRRDEHVRLISQMRSNEFLVVAGNQKATVDVFPTIVIHRQMNVSEIRVQFEEDQEIASTDMKTNPSDRNQRRRRTSEKRLQIPMRDVPVGVIAEIQRNLPHR